MELANQLVNLIKNEDMNNLIVHIKNRPYNDKRYYVCDKKLKNLGWSQSIDISNGLLKTIEWYKVNIGRFEK